MEGLIMTAQLILGLSILVTLHEFGHFITAKWFGMRVNKFYLFFDFMFPLPHVLNFALFKFTKNETEYGLGWFPLGGYVSIAGMIDETQDASTLAKTPEPWEFRAKPAWQRLIVMLGGVIVNAILGILIFTGLAAFVGDDYISKDAVNKRGIVAYELGQYAGFKTGDKIIKINGKDFDKFDDVRSTKVLMDDNGSYTVDRAGQIIELKVPSDFLNKLSDNKSEFIDPIFEFEVKKVAPSLQQNANDGEDAVSPAKRAGLQEGDRITSLAGKKITYYHELKEALAATKGKEIALEINRKGKGILTNIKVSKSGRIGFTPNNIDPEHTPKHISYNLGEAFSAGTSRAFGVVTDNMKGFGKIFSGQISPSKALSGPVEIAQMYGATWDWTRFWTLTGMLSMALAFMNLLPIPALDGGHAVFLIYEMIVGKAPSEKFMERAQGVGTFILLSLMVFVIGKGIFKLF